MTDESNTKNEEISEKYDKFFKELKEFKKEQEKQKQRGHNNYNVMSVLRKPTEEVGMHSRFIFSLLNTNGKHFQGDLFLKLFIKHALKMDDDMGDIVSVKREDSTDENKRVDFVIKTSNYIIGIEMKVNHHDSKYQMSDYFTYLKQEAKKDGIDEQNVKIFYLTKTGKKASKDSLEYRNKTSLASSENETMEDSDYTRISFRKHILDWLKECQKEVSNITNLNEVLRQYIEVVQMVNKEYKGKIMTIIDYLKNINDDSKRNDYINILNSTKNEYSRAKAKLKKDFFKGNLVDYLSIKLKEDKDWKCWNVELGGEINKIDIKYKTHIKFFKNKDWKVVYWLRFHNNDMNSLYWAVARLTDKLDLTNINNEIKNNGLICSHKQTRTSILWKFSDFDLDKNIHLLIEEKAEKYDELSKNILNEFKNTIGLLKENYKTTIDDINKKIIQNDPI
ncbi:MAG: hypothetical protein DRG11_05870 [Epsilonproteobacteria bacterium]|nr:MAG: hypothetical protein DRG11_05870 [Campylobacterota bacterium]